MDISNFSVEDFVLDASFRAWVLNPSPAMHSQWQASLKRYPSKKSEVHQARQLLLNYVQPAAQIPAKEVDQVWDAIAREIQYEEGRDLQKGKIIPLHPNLLLDEEESNATEIVSLHPINQWKRVAGILLFCLTLSIIANLFLATPLPPEPTMLVYMENITTEGQKSLISLSDGSSIMLNSNSRISYPKDFEGEKREVHLEGEAYFDVAKDASKPFIVHTGNTSTLALGTAFNIKSYKNELREIALLEGKVQVNDTDLGKELVLQPGDGVKLDKQNRNLSLYRYDLEMVTAWREKKIIFNETPLHEMVRTLENWYGVHIIIERKPGTDLLVSGKFEDENLKNVLEGLSYTARFTFEIKEKEVKINFN
ncbi:hypothetical protein GCM10007049_11740 [Echinicola pacifica]|uniref:FecR family protein n=1 Tax=Echinicola pacifica TaxID=346377 RepID=A0A918UMJ4_9BACT|nr:FecR domain-containing protein [Echinicola pacifica]GGZ20798.1 hypothetical protein GCM10007049_11740 [Echinicola pacifica]